MKTRIVYPRLWLDEKFSACSLPTKLLFSYLINNLQLGLSRYLHITDRQIMFDTGLTVNQLRTGKEELTNIRWCFFTDNWVYHNHEAAYVDYDGRDRVLTSKEDEINSVPEKIKEVFKGLITGYEPVLNHKSETINNKLDKRECEREKTWDEKKPTNEQLLKISTDYQVPLSFVESKWDDVVNHCNSIGKPNKYSDWVATLRNWVKRDAIRLKEGSNHGRRIAVVPIPE